MKIRLAVSKRKITNSGEKKIEVQNKYSTLETLEGLRSLSALFSIVYALLLMVELFNSNGKEDLLMSVQVFILFVVIPALLSICLFILCRRKRARIKEEKEILVEVEEVDKKREIMDSGEKKMEIQKEPVRTVYVPTFSFSSFILSLFALDALYTYEAQRRLEQLQKQIKLEQFGKKRSLF